MTFGCSSIPMKQVMHAWVSRNNVLSYTMDQPKSNNLANTRTSCLHGPVFPTAVAGLALVPLLCCLNAVNMQSFIFQLSTKQNPNVQMPPSWLWRYIIPLGRGFMQCFAFMVQSSHLNRSLLRDFVFASSPAVDAQNLVFSNHLVLGPCRFHCGGLLVYGR